MFIGLSGKMRAGKNLVAELISNEVKPQKIILASFSDPLYDVLKFTCDHFNLPFEKDRQFLQFIGTDYARRRDPNVFLRIMTEKIESVQRYPELSMIVPDIRFPNEADLLKEAGFTLINIVRPEEERLKLVALEENQSHESEKALKHYKFDYTLYNNGSIDELGLNVSRLLTNLRSLGA